MTIARDSSDSPEGAKKAIHLTVKMPSNTLREATSSKRKSGAPDGLEPAEIITGPRSNRGRKSYVVESESDDDEEEDEEGSEGDGRVEEQIGEAEATDDDDVDGDGNEEEEEEQEGDEVADDDEGESGDVDDEDDEDVEMDDGSPMPPPPVIKMTGAASKPTVTVTHAKNAKLKSVEDKEIEMEDEDEDLSSIESGGEEDAEGEEEDELDQDDEGDLQTPPLGSRASTPDVSKMTKRQKSRLSEVMGNDFLQLPMGKPLQCIQLVSIPPPNARSQNHKSKNTSRPPNTRNAAPKWPAAAKTSASAATKKRKSTPSTAF